MIIGIDARAADEEPAGRGRYVRELLRALARRDDAHQYLLYARKGWDGGLDRRFSWRLIRARDPAWNLFAARAASRDCDVFLSSNSYLTTWFLRVPGVPVVYDLVTFDRSLRPSRRSELIERLTLGLAVRRSAALVAISQSTADALVARFPGAATRVAVTPLGVPEELASGSPASPSAALDELPDSFVLAVGTLEPRKNLPRLVAAYRSLPEALQARNPLVVAGRLGWDTDETLRTLEQLGDRARVLGYVPDPDLAALYRRCTVFCYPSLGEGFGLPVLEAMHAGAVVLTSDRPSLPEVGGDAVAYVDPHDVAGIARELERLLQDPARRAELSARARERARAFDWADTAARTLATLESAAARGRA